jgi:hypothetical protein
MVLDVLLNSEFGHEPPPANRYVRQLLCEAVRRCLGDAKPCG